MVTQTLNLRQKVIQNHTKPLIYLTISNVYYPKAILKN